MHRVAPGHPCPLATRPPPIHPLAARRSLLARIRRCPAWLQYDLKTAPLLVYYGPTSIIGHGKNKFPPSAQYTGELDAENAALFVREKTNYTVAVKRSLWPKVIAAVVALAAISAAIFFMGDSAISLFVYVRSLSWLWLLACFVSCGVHHTQRRGARSPPPPPIHRHDHHHDSFRVCVRVCLRVRLRICLQAVYYISVSGVLYDIIRGVPPFGYDPRTKRMVVVAQQSGTQYGVEGLIIGGFNMAAGLGVIILTRVLPRMKDSSARNGVAAGAAALFLIFYFQVYSWYHYKNPWYSIGALIR